jgi:hypothetical protein
VKTNPEKDFVKGGDGRTGPLRLALNTAQTGRTFQDRSHKFRILQRPQEVPAKCLRLRCSLSRTHTHTHALSPSLPHTHTHTHSLSQVAAEAVIHNLNVRGESREAPHQHAHPLASCLLPNASRITRFILSSMHGSGRRAIQQGAHHSQRRILSKSWERVTSPKEL